MNFEELEHIVRVAREVTGETEFLAIGSQSLLVSFRDLPRELRRSPELDISARSNPQVADLIDGNLGEITPFRRQSEDQLTNRKEENLHVPLLF